MVKIFSPDGDWFRVLQSQLVNLASEEVVSTISPCLLPNSASARSIARSRCLGVRAGGRSPLAAAVTPWTKRSTASSDVIRRPPIKTLSNLMPLMPFSRQRCNVLMCTLQGGVRAALPKLTIFSALMSITIKSPVCANAHVAKRYSKCCATHSNTPSNALACNDLRRSARIFVCCDDCWIVRIHADSCGTEKNLGGEESRWAIIAEELQEISDLRKDFLAEWSLLEREMTDAESSFPKNGPWR